MPDEAAPIRVVEGPDSCIMDGFDRWGQLRRSAARPSESGWDALDAGPPGETIGYWGFAEGAGNSIGGGQAFGIARGVETYVVHGFQLAEPDVLRHWIVSPGGVADAPIFLSTSASTMRPISGCRRRSPSLTTCLKFASTRVVAA